MRVYRTIPVATALIAIASVGHTSAAAQSTTSRPVVQAIPSAESAELSDALREVSQRPNDIPVLIKAGDAALESGDLAAAERFFRRIQEIEPGDARAKLGLAAIAVRKEDPFTALRLFDEAQAAGVDSLRYSGDHGLAYDLVGDTVRAQRFYQLSMAVKPRPEMIRRMALSQAISGDIRGAEATLLPLLRNEDLAAFRTRAFALAIAGKQGEAMSIAETLMPEASAKRLEPYLNSLPKLTRAQQAAAGNFGHFPLATQVGIDDPRVATYAAGNVPPIRLAQEASDRLVPQGQPLGGAGNSESQLARPVLAQAEAVSAQAEAPQQTRTVRRSAQRDLSDVSDPLARTRGRRTQVVSASELREPEERAAENTELAAPASNAVATQVASAPPVAVPTRGELPPIGAPVPAPASAPAPAPAPAPVPALAPGAATASAANATASVPAVDDVTRLSNSMTDFAAPPTEIDVDGDSQLPPMVPLQADAGRSLASTDDAMAETAAATVPDVPAPSIDVLGSGERPAASAALAEQSAPTPVARAAPVVVSRIESSPAPSPAVPRAIERVAMQPSTVAQEVVQAIPQATQAVEAAASAPTAPASVADAFADFDLGEPAPAPRPVDAVDITKIDIPIEKVAEEKEAAPAKPANPSRIWVQVATGQDRSALRFDFRRISRQAPELFEGKEGFTAQWNETNRLVTGPFASARAARDFVNELKEKGIESFTFTSEDGQEIEALPKR